MLQVLLRRTGPSKREIWTGYCVNPNQSAHEYLLVAQRLAYRVWRNAKGKVISKKLLARRVYGDPYPLVTGVW